MHYLSRTTVTNWEPLEAGINLFPLSTKLGPDGDLLRQPRQLWKCRQLKSLVRTQSPGPEGSPNTPALLLPPM